MLEITIPANEMWDPVKEEFIQASKAETLQLEHSLISLSKWESKWKKPFLDKGLQNYEETIDYIRCMTVSKVTDPSVYYRIPVPEINKVGEYIHDPMTATWFSDDSKKKSRKSSYKKEIVTAEILYYDMIALGIPFECQKWHLNRLITLIRVCQRKQEKPEKQSRGEIIARNKELNAARRAAMRSKG